MSGAGLQDKASREARNTAAHATYEEAAQNPGSVIDLRSSQPAGQAPDLVERLAKVAALKEQGLLSDAEFAAAKAKILGES